MTNTSVKRKKRETENKSKAIVRAKANPKVGNLKDKISREKIEETNRIGSLKKDGVLV